MPATPSQATRDSGPVLLNAFFFQEKLSILLYVQSSIFKCPHEYIAAQPRCHRLQGTSLFYVLVRKKTISNQTMTLSISRHSQIRDVKMWKKICILESTKYSNFHFLKTMNRLFGFVLKLPDCTLFKSRGS